MQPRFVLGTERSVRLVEILRPEQNSFGVIRVAMAIAVLVSHSYYFVAGTSSAEPLVSWTGHSLGEHAVQVFFFLSGILVTESLLRSRNPFDFATARALRIFPGLLVCVALTACVLGPLVTNLPASDYFRDPAIPAYILKTALLVTGAAPLPRVFDQLPAGGLVNMSLWTLKYEVACYVALAILGFTALRHRRPRELAALALIPLTFMLFLRAPAEAATYSSTDNLRYFALYFGVGTLASLYKDRIVIGWRAAATLGLAYLVLRDTPFAELACALFIGSSTLLAATCTFGRLRALANRRDISFGIYIYAAPIQQAILQSYPELKPFELTLAAVIPVVTLASGSWVYVERPALAWRAAITFFLTNSAKTITLLAERVAGLSPH